MSIRGRSRAVAISKTEHFVIIVNGFQPLTIVTKGSILDVAAALDPPLPMLFFLFFFVVLSLFASPSSLVKQVLPFLLILTVIGKFLRVDKVSKSLMDIWRNQGIKTEKSYLFYLSVLTNIFLRDSFALSINGKVSRCQLFS